MKISMTCIVLAALTVATASAQSSTNEFSRKGKWEVYGFGQAEKVFNVFDSDVDVYGGGLGAGYNFSQYINVNADFSISSARIHHTPFLFGPTYSESTTLYMGHLSLDYNWFKSRVTPLLSLRVGIGGGGESLGTIADQMIGIGVRWDASDRLFVKAILNAGAWEKLSDEGNGWAAMGFSMGVGFMF